MSKYKMLCLDIDGTLINSQHKITENTKKAVKRAAEEKLIKVILVSARMPKGIWFLQRELEVSQPIICYNGALIVDNNTDILWNISIPVSHVEEVYNLAKETGISISLYKEDQWYVEEVDQWAECEGEITRSYPEIIKYDELFSKWKMEKSGPNKILCMAEPDRIKLLDSKLKDRSYGNLNIALSKPEYLEIIPQDASKTAAIEFLCRRFEIKESEVIAIGDNYNDINMIEFAGLGVAMGNAPEQVKKYADDITLSNDEDGVAEAVKKHILR
jgi:Cof subfamily protein (haloacid dehalogenase superfamily)